MTKERKPMQQMDFTIKNVEALKPPTEGRLELKDTKAPGLYLRVTPSGVKSFSFVGRPKGSSRTERTTLGKYPAVKPEEARRLRDSSADMPSQLTPPTTLTRAWSSTCRTGSLSTGATGSRT